ncbi:succinoglycan biosynthesis protein ExoH [Pseudorhizobium tarimense]|uniref:Succinoglycan biosynthesis protein ExoH n=1 Tax=Pseudorhizobium tarimense TaxID=1079109 RepID=A0ABV2H0T4_9HYPH
MAVDQNLSSRINLMRILLIGGIVFVHVPFNDETSPFLGTFGAFDWLRVFLGESLFRIGVPCLSAISGYLLFRRGVSNFQFAPVVLSKLNTVLLPFLLWNLGLLLLVLLMQQAQIGIGYFPDMANSGPAEMADHAFALQGYPVNLPLYFLRDLLVCILLSPILAALVHRAPWLTCGSLFLLAILPYVTIGLVLKKSILFSFALGIAVAIHGLDAKALDRHAAAGVVVVLLAAIVLAAGLYWTGPAFPYWLELAQNTLSIVGALGFWLLSALLIRSALGQKLAQTGSLSFWVFCAHYPLLVGLWMVWNRVGSADAYPFFYVGALIVTFTVLVTSNAMINRLLPTVYKVLTGSRGRRRPSALAPGGARNAEATATNAAALSQDWR